MKRIATACEAQSIDHLNKYQNPKNCQKKSPLKSLLVISVTAVLSTAILSACDKQPKATQAEQQMPPMQVEVQVIEFAAQPVFKTLAGRTAAYKSSEVRPQVTGIIDEVLFQEGSFVAAGQPLYRINVDNYRSAVASAEAAVAQAQANVATAQANLVSAQANHAQAQADLSRLEGLLQVDAISRQAYDQAVTATRTTNAAVQAAQATVRQSQAAVGAAQAALNASQLDMSRTIVRAPIAGKSGISAVSTGALVSSGQAASLVTISQLDPIYVDISQSSSEILALQQQLTKGEAIQGTTQVELVLEDGSVYPMVGQLTLSDAKVDEVTGSVTLRAVFANPERTLLPGMYVNARLAQTVIERAVLLPQTAMIRTPKGDTQVYVVTKDNKIEVKDVTVAGTQDGKWVITGGLQNGDRVVVNGAAKVKPDQVVAPKVINPPQAPNQQNANTQASQAQAGQVGSGTVMRPQNASPQVANQAQAGQRSAQPNAQQGAQIPGQATMVPNQPSMSHQGAQQAPATAPQAANSPSAGNSNANKRPTPANTGNDIAEQAEALAAADGADF